MLTIFSRGNTVINQTKPGVWVNQAVSIPGMLATDTVVITPITSTVDGQGVNQLIATAGADGFTVTSVRSQLARDVTIEFIVARGTS